MSPVAILAVGVLWGVVLTFALGLARAAGKPTPEPARETFPALDQVTFDWPAVDANVSYRLEDRRG